MFSLGFFMFYRDLKNKVRKYIGHRRFSDDDLGRVNAVRQRGDYEPLFFLNTTFVTKYV